MIMAAVEFPAWSAVPFFLLLVCMAILPLIAEQFWHRHHNKAFVVFVLAGPLCVYFTYQYFLGNRATFELLVHELEKYLFFITLLGSLYVVAGGIILEWNLEPRPLANTAILAAGALLANFFGTTGASVLLIRPVLRMNQVRRRTTHIPLFFIFLVGNAGGLLTPLGDPPLFLGFLNGVPFFWTLRLWPQWLFVNGALLVLFFICDHIAYRREDSLPLKRENGDGIDRPPLVRGWVNVSLLFGVVVGVLIQGVLPPPYGEWSGAGVMLAMAVLSYLFTSRKLRELNGFTWGPIVEVAILFLGIFLTMTPALALLSDPKLPLSLSSAWEYFWITGLLSSFLDNAPTYMTLATLAAGGSHLNWLAADQIPDIPGPLVLEAISCGAVFMGALTYIGNGPNLMVQAIAEHTGFKMPGFLSYTVIAVIVLLPILLLATLLFFVGT